MPETPWTPGPGYARIIELMRQEELDRQTPTTSEPTTTTPPPADDTTNDEDVDATEDAE